MIELGKVQQLFIVSIASNGVYLAESTSDTDVRVLLRNKDVPDQFQLGDCICVFVYRDTEDKLIATTRTPKIVLGELALLSVLYIDANGAFLDIGLEKDLFLPFKEQTKPLSVGERVLVAMYIDKSDRLCATMKLGNYLQTNSHYKPGDRAVGTVYSIHDELGFFVAVDNRFSGCIHHYHVFGSPCVGEEIKVRIQYVKPDGKLDLSNKPSIDIQIGMDSETIWNWLLSHDGVIPFTDKADPITINKVFGMSKNAFKRAIGHLLKFGKIRITANSIEIVNNIENSCI